MPRCPAVQPAAASVGPLRQRIYVTRSCHLKRDKQWGKEPSRPEPLQRSGFLQWRSSILVTALPNRYCFSQVGCLASK